ncbi:MAG: hypothetical protein BGO67_05435 [Alphaproteobacteria bacterium 41-28]|nr:MAG: hypothetical protein BGO67_05435 [Alphaproteobacteria bacterium 41-28]
MRNTQILFPQELYSKYLSTINGIHFTQREIDVIACVLNGWSTKRIASLLLLKPTAKGKIKHQPKKTSKNIQSINPRTVQTHIRNIMSKLDCNTREGIIDFIEASDRLIHLRKYYSLLRIEIAFEKSLKDIFKLRHEQEIILLIVHKKDKNTKNPLLSHLKAHLKLVGITISSTVRKKESEYAIYILPKLDEKNDISSLLEKVKKSHKEIFFVLQEKESHKNIPEKFRDLKTIDFTKYENYYFSFIKLLKILCPNLEFEKVVTDFKDKYKKIHGSIEFQQPQPLLKEKEPENHFTHHLRWVLLFVPFIVVFMGYWFVTRVWNPDDANHPIRPDLVIPKKSVLLDRPQLIAQIDDKFKGHEDIQTIALVGPGGAGKTTLARQYAHQQKVKVVWEINAETQESLRTSFENLAQALVATEGDKKILRAIQEIKNPAEREDKIIQFVKKRLKSHLHWFIIYDNIEKFLDIQKHFPHDFKTWGQGKIILTTRDGTIENNKHVNSIIQVGELTPEQKLSLFTKIMTNDHNHSLKLALIEETKIFLKALPPYPLDVSVAAYYLKATNIPYAAYLKSVTENNKDFINVQENLLKEAGDYTKTRYGIITLSLQHILDTHKDFSDLLLFISMLDSQNIPQSLLRTYKSETVVDNFIYNLKKYSLITNQSSSSPFGSTFSIHRSVQGISLAYLIKILNLKKKPQLFQGTFKLLDKTISEIISDENISKMKALVTHSEIFLSHDNLITSEMRGGIAGKLGCFYFYFGKYLLSKQLLEKGLKILDNLENKDYARIAQMLTFLAIVYRELGNYEKARSLFEQSLVIYKDILDQQWGIVWVSVHLGNIYREMGNYEKGRLLIEHALTRQKNKFSGDPIQFAWTLLHLGNLYRDLGNFEGAKNLYEKSLEIYRKKFNDNEHIGAAWVLSHLGSVQKELGNYQEAKISLEKSLKIYSNHFDKLHLKVACASFYLGNVYKELGDYEKAKNFIEQALLAYEKNYGKDDLHTAKALISLGQIYLLKGQVETSESLMFKASRIVQKTKHPDKYIILEALAGLFIKKSADANDKSMKQQSRDFKARATDYLKQALEIIKTNFPEDSPHLIRIQGKLKNLSQE